MRILYGTWLARFKLGRKVSLYMRIITNTLIILVISCSAAAQMWPSGAISDPEAGLPCPPAGQLSLRLSGTMLSNETWTDNRSKFSIAMGLGRGLGISAGGSFRDLSGLGAFQRGIEDTKVGLSCWPKLLPNFSAGVNGYFLIPTGYRTQESYFDQATDSTHTLPAFSLEQTAGEIYGGAVWTLGPSAEVNGFIGYFSTSDKIHQAFRWGLGAAIAPFGPRAVAEFGYSHSMTRTGTMPSTEAFNAALAINVLRYLTIAPGMWADLSEEPLYGGFLSLRFSAPVARVTVNERGMAAPISDLPKLGGTVLVPPPLTTLDLADGSELWQSIQEGVGNTFDGVIALSSLDVPGLPFNEQSADQVHQSIRALAKAHPEADWLLISRVERENVMRESGVKIPLVMEQPLWTAQCKVRVKLVNLRDGQIRYQDLVDAKASRRTSGMKTMISNPDREVLSMSASRELTFEAYREAGRVIARELSYAQ